MDIIDTDKKQIVAPIGDQLLLRRRHRQKILANKVTPSPKEPKSIMKVVDGEKDAFDHFNPTAEDLDNVVHYPRIKLDRVRLESPEPKKSKRRSTFDKVAMKKKQKYSPEEEDSSFAVISTKKKTFKTVVGKEVTYTSHVNDENSSSPLSCDLAFKTSDKAETKQIKKREPGNEQVRMMMTPTKPRSGTYGTSPRERAQYFSKNRKAAESSI